MYWIDEMDRFWSSNRQISAYRGKKPLRNISLRLCRYGAKALVQEPLSAFTVDGQEQSVRGALERLAPDVVTGSTLTVGWRVLVQGVEAPLEASLVWLMLHLACADNFLYLVLVPSAAS